MKILILIALFLISFQYEYNIPDIELLKVAKKFQDGVFSTNKDMVLSTLLNSSSFEYNHKHAHYNPDGSPVMINGIHYIQDRSLKGYNAAEQFLSMAFPASLYVCIYPNEKLTLRVEPVYNGVRGYHIYTPYEETRLVRMGGGYSMNAEVTIQQLNTIELEGYNYEFYFKLDENKEIKISSVYAYDRVVEAPQSIKDQVYAQSNKEQACKIVNDYYRTIKNAAFADLDKIVGY